jgi:hypothetical protein
MSDAGGAYFGFTLVMPLSLLFELLANSLVTEDTASNY